ncbi:DUF3349 domain-containing protein [Brachybacterium phenoliresistens]|uniref:DUF3349 domain-containing protein n=1 Tax=Brachybacterium phenoliresistens TaxID=396014 RepID=Z9JSU2_9MICO|nr:DUF3349 domain-containing protein [Brachybacterium phenoliresistens]EWS81063.1 hypothetical protein BF93_17965 [Brachybacterium phenoliresistens]
MSNPLNRVLDWLRAGYPDGVPPTDVSPLLALLSRTLRPEELDEIVAAVIRENPQGDIDARDVHGAIEHLTDTPATPASVRAVAARLAAVGWPLSEAPDDDQLREIQRTPAPDLPASEHQNLAQRILAWLTEGYPEGIPPTDRLPLMALLRRRLTDEEVEQIARRLVDDARSPEIDAADAGALITRYTRELPAESDLTRLASHLAAKGWPLRSSRRD